VTLPFSPEAFVALFAQYNSAIWPAQIAAGAAGLLVLAAALRPFRGGGRLAAGLLAALWLWTGIVYHGQFFATLSFFAPGFALIFVVQGALFVWTGFRRGGLAFRASGIAGRTGVLLMIYALAIYPLTGWLAGHVWLALPAFGVTPGPLTLFTMGALLAVDGRTPWHLVVLPVAWSLVGGSAVWLLGMTEDIALPLAGVGGAALIALKNGRIRRDAIPAA